MADHWCNIESRFGEVEAASPPTDREIAEVVAHVLDDAALRRRDRTLEEGYLEEHPNAWMEMEDDEGATYVLDLYRTGELQFTRYGDDPEVEEFRHVKQGVSVAEATRLWRLLRDGRVAEVEAAFRGGGRRPWWKLW